jgi:hypothetical protein
MIPFPEYLLWIGATLLAGYVAALSRRLGVARHFPLLTSYLVLSLFAGLARWVTFARWGLVSELYMDLYYGSDLVLAVAVYLVILELQRPLYRLNLQNSAPVLAGNCQSLDDRLVRRNLEIERAAINVLHL